MSQFFLNTFLMYFIGLSIFVPLMLYVVNPAIQYLLHGIPYAVTESKALNTTKMFYFILFASTWISGVLVLQQYLSYYLKLRRGKKHINIKE